VAVAVAGFKCFTLLGLEFKFDKCSKSLLKKSAQISINFDTFIRLTY